MTRHGIEQEVNQAIYNKETQIPVVLCMVSIIYIVSIILFHELLSIQMPKYLPWLSQAVQCFSPSISFIIYKMEYSKTEHRQMTSPLTSKAYSIASGCYFGVKLLLVLNSTVCCLIISGCYFTSPHPCTHNVKICRSLLNFLLELAFNESECNPPLPPAQSGRIA